MKKLLVLTILFSLVMSFSPPEKVVKVNISDDICFVDQDVNVEEIEITVVAGLNPLLLNEAEVEISPGVNQKANETTMALMVALNDFDKELMLSERVKIQKQDFNNCKDKRLLYNKYTLNHKLYEISPGDMLI